MSRPLYVMRERFERLRSIRGAHSRRCPPRVGSSSIRVNRSLTVPLLCSLRWCGFQVEGAYQIEGGITQGQAFDTGPQVDDAGHRQLLFKMGEVHEGDVAHGAAFWYGGIPGRGDLFPNRPCRTLEA